MREYNRGGGIARTGNGIKGRVRAPGGRYEAEARREIKERRKSHPFRLVGIYIFRSASHQAATQQEGDIDTVHCESRIVLS